MIVAKAPLRMSFVGGGSDLPAFYSRSTGKVISTSINKYVYVAVNKKFDDSIRVSYSKTENCNHPDEIEHPIIRECLKYCAIDKGIEIISMADIPGEGSGLGSSSTFTAALLRALYAFKGENIGDNELAKLACEIEIERCKAPIGKQDQYAAVLGGYNKITFNQDDSVAHLPIRLERDVTDEINRHLLVLYTGKTRSASKILKEQSLSVEKFHDKFDLLRRMVELVDPFHSVLSAGKILEMGQILDANWRLKSAISKGISDPWIDEAYSQAIVSGAYGGKIMGAGAGGFFLFLADPNYHEKIASALKMKKVDVKTETGGCEIILSER